jgi:hypothetical protein
MNTLKPKLIYVDVRSSATLVFSLRLLIGFLFFFLVIIFGLLHLRYQVDRFSNLCAACDATTRRRRRHSFSLFVAFAHRDLLSLQRICAKKFDDCVTFEARALDSKIPPPQCGKGYGSAKYTLFFVESFIILYLIHRLYI